MVEINSSKLKCAFNVLIVVIFTSYLFFNINTYVHEKGHQEAFLEKGIDSEINLNHNVVGSGGITQFNSKDDCENFNSLSKKNKNKIFFAGIKSELMLLSVLLIMLFLIQIKANKKSLNNYYIKWALLLFIIIILYSLINNLNPYKEFSDAWKIANNFIFNCGLINFG